MSINLKSRKFTASASDRIKKRAIRHSKENNQENLLKRATSKVIFRKKSADGRKLKNAHLGWKHRYES